MTSTEPTGTTSLDAMLEGKSLEEQQIDIIRLMQSDPAKYNLPETQARLDKILAERMESGELDELGTPTRRHR
ncbi:MAG: hypothetical protein J0I57_07135 [Hyphomicrobium sp.]|nr:hypothetical protein [Hyphomicrobium sp.]